jgi:hypothetical protein
MQRTSSPFVGRARELSELMSAWVQVAAGQGPRTVVVLAESGLGKTRLAQALYEAIAADGAANLEGERGYWPTVLGADGNNLRVNPPLDACAPAAPMPFLWWGIRLVDPLAPNHLAGGVLPSSVERDLLPHLEPLQRASRRRDRHARVAKVAAGLATDALVDAVPFASLLKTLVATGLELKGIHDEGRRDGAGRDLGAAAEARALTFLDRVVGDLGALLRPGGAPPSCSSTTASSRPTTPARSRWWSGCTARPRRKGGRCSCSSRTGSRSGTRPRPGPSRARCAPPTARPCRSCA